MSVVKGLWIGNDLGELEKLCIKSFQKQGHIFELFIYGEIGGIPEKTKIRDGNDILEEKEIFKFKESYLPFSDLFRYKLLYDKGGIWVDADMVLLNDFEFDKKHTLISSEHTFQSGAFKSYNTYKPNIGLLKFKPNADS